jgi:hypothetical protein
VFETRRGYEPVVTTLRHTQLQPAGSSSLFEDQRQWFKVQCKTVGLMVDEILAGRFLAGGEHRLEPYKNHSDDHA